LDVFVVRDLSLGGSVQGSYGDGRGHGADGSLVDTTSTSLVASLRVGLNLRLSDPVSLWPHLGIGFEWQQQAEQLVSGRALSIPGSALGYPTTTRYGPWASIDFPLVVHPRPHFFVGVGPSPWHEFGTTQGGPNVGVERTSVAGALVLGGWLGGRSAADADEAQCTLVPRFGMAHQVALNNEIELQGGWLGYKGSNSNTTNVYVRPGLDYFVVDHISIGASITVGYANIQGIDATTSAVVTTTRTSVALAGRLGGDVPQGDWLSFYPRAYVGVGQLLFSEVERSIANKATEVYVWIAAYAPILVHAASHFFIGFGPSFSQDVTHSVTYPSSPATSTQNRSTSVGAGAVVGGWL
jgi:hypothetical protein